MYFINYFGFDISSIFLASVLNAPVGYVDGHYQPHVCNSFASVAEQVTSEIKKSESFSTGFYFKS